MGLFSKKLKEYEITQIKIIRCKFCDSKELFQLRVSDMLTCYDWGHDVFCCRICGRVMSSKDFKVKTTLPNGRNES